MLFLYIVTFILVAAVFKIKKVKFKTPLQGVLYLTLVPTLILVFGLLIRAITVHLLPA